MPKCPACGKEVYFGKYVDFVSELCAFLAERKTSLGKDWHKSCLKCVRCKKVLSPGGHAVVSNYLLIILASIA